MWNICLLIFVDDEFSVLFYLQTRLFQTNTSCQCVSSNSKQNSIKFVGLLTSVIHSPSHFYAPVRIRFLKFCWNCTSNKFSVIGLHMFGNFFRHLLVESSQENWPYHYSRVISKSCQKASTLKGHIWSSNNQCFSWCTIQHKEVVTCDTEFFVSWNTGVGRTTTSCNNNVFCCDSLLFFAVIEM